MEVPCTPPMIEVARLLVSELATNAVRHARTETFTVEVDVDDVTASVSVCDEDPTTVQAQSLPEPPAEAGRGLRLVEDLAERWWCDERPDGAGKAVGFELPCS